MRKLALIVVAILFWSCKSNEQQNASSAETNDTLIAEITPYESSEEDEAPDDSPAPHDIIDYASAREDEYRASLENFSPAMEVLTLASAIMDFKDSLYYAHESSYTEADRKIIEPKETEAYNAILRYQEAMKQGPTFDDQCPSLLSLTRNVGTNDSTNDYLTTPRASSFLANGDFFFLGGAPFINDVHAENRPSFQDPNGKPEVRFSASITENANYLMNALYHSKKIPTSIVFGPPLESYDSGPIEIKEVGSLIHEFIERVPVFFLTEKGLLNAQLVSISLKLVPQQMGCISDQPEMVFAYQGLLDSREILGIYIPFKSSIPTTSVIAWPHRYVWTADLNADGIPDVAGVSGTYPGISSDVMEEMLWFVNVNGEWKIIDAGADLDCT